MVKTYKTLYGHVESTLYWGIISFLTGLAFVFVVHSSDYVEDWSIYYIPIKILGAFLGHMWVSYWNPGGLVTFNFNRKKFSEDEKKLNELSFKYRSKKIMLLVPFLYIFFDYLLGKSKYQSEVSYLDGFLGEIFISFFIVAAMTNGIKYISVWWNIRRNWKKEFGEK